MYTEEHPKRFLSLLFFFLVFFYVVHTFYIFRCLIEFCNHFLRHYWVWRDREHNKNDLNWRPPRFAKPRRCSVGERATATLYELHTFLHVNDVRDLLKRNDYGKNGHFLIIINRMNSWSNAIRSINASYFCCKHINMAH